MVILKGKWDLATGELTRLYLLFMLQKMKPEDEFHFLGRLKQMLGFEASVLRFRLSYENSSFLCVWEGLGEQTLDELMSYF